MLAAKPVRSAARRLLDYKWSSDYEVRRKGPSMPPRCNAKRTEQAIIDQLPERARADTSDLRVSVTDTTVTLDGTMPHECAHQAILTAVRSLCADQAIRDHLVVRFSATSTTPSGEDLRAAIQSLFGWVPGIDVRDPVVRLEDGVIIVQGATVSATAKKNVAEAIRNEFGVVDLDNRLSIDPAEDNNDSPSSPLNETTSSPQTSQISSSTKKEP